MIKRIKRVGAVRLEETGLPERVHEKRVFAQTTKHFFILRVEAVNETHYYPLYPKSFSQSRNMESHKRIHTGEKPFKCPLCTKSFSESGNMERHKRIHTGERPYKCPLYPKSFSQSPPTGSHHQLLLGRATKRALLALAESQTRRMPSSCK